MLTGRNLLASMATEWLAASCWFGFAVAVAAVAFPRTASHCHYCVVTHTQAQATDYRAGRPQYAVD